MGSGGHGAPKRRGSSGRRRTCDTGEAASSGFRGSSSELPPCGRPQEPSDGPGPNAERAFSEGICLRVHGVCACVCMPVRAGAPVWGAGLRVVVMGPRGASMLLQNAAPGLSGEPAVLHSAGLWERRAGQKREVPALRAPRPAPPRCSVPAGLGTRPLGGSLPGHPLHADEDARTARRRWAAWAPPFRCPASDLVLKNRAAWCRGGGCK